MARQILAPVMKYLLVGLLIREGLSFWTGHSYDFEIWVRLGVYMQHFGDPYTTLPYVQSLSFEPYPVTGSISYPPLSAFIFAGVYKLYLSMGISSRFLYYFLLKQPIVLSDLAIGMILSKIALDSWDKEQARRVFKIWMLFPFAIVVSSVWGALDPIALFLILASVYYFQQGRMFLSGVPLGLAIYLKTLPVIALPVLLMQPSASFRERVQLSSLCLSIPFLGTLLPAVGLGWGFKGMLSNFSYEAIIHTYGALSPFGALGLLSVPPWVKSITGLIWLPALVLAYFYIRKRKFSLAEGLVTAFLVFSVSRPFLPEQWAIYPLAFLLLSRKNIGNFTGLAVVGFSALAANSTLFVNFISPVSTIALNWESMTSITYYRVIIVFLLACFFLLESTLALAGRPSLVFRALSSVSYKTRRVSQIEIWRDQHG